eukprot:gene36191-13242_t
MSQTALMQTCMTAPLMQPPASRHLVPEDSVMWQSCRSEKPPPPAHREYDSPPQHPSRG